MTNRLCEMIAEKLDCDVSEINETTKFTDLGIDSLDIAEIIMEIESEFSVSLKFDASIVDVKTLVEKIDQELKAKL